MEGNDLVIMQHLTIYRVTYACFDPSSCRHRETPSHQVSTCTLSTKTKTSAETRRRVVAIQPQASLPCEPRHSRCLDPASSQADNALLNQRPEPAPAASARKLAAAPPPRAPPAGVIGMLIKQFEGDPAVVVDDLTPGGPAAACGQIQVGDHLLAVDGRPVAGMSLPAIHGLINGPAGQSLRLQMAQQPRGAGVGGGGGGGGGSSTPREGRGDALSAISSACYTITTSGAGGGGGSGANTPRRPSQDQSSAGRTGGVVYEVELVRAALDIPIE
jgi:hypothetical protein